MHGLQSGSVHDMDTRDGRVTHTLGRMKQARIAYHSREQTGFKTHELFVSENLTQYFMQLSVD